MDIKIKLKKIGFINVGKLIIFALIFFLILPVISLLNANAASTASVTATVTAQNISVSVSDGSVAYGTLALSGTNDTNPADTQTATNDGNITENFNIRGQNSAAWTLSGSVGTDQYVHSFCTATCGTAPTNYTALTTNYQTLATSIASSGTQTFDLYIQVPSSSSSYTEQSVNVTVQAVSP